MRFSSAENRDSPFSSESIVRIDAIITIGDIVKLAARTGAPAYANARFTPIVRSQVLLPALFAPLTTRIDCLASISMSLGMAPSLIRGWARFFAFRIGPSFTISGNGQPAYSNAKQAREEYASNRATA